MNNQPCLGMAFRELRSKLTRTPRSNPGGGTRPGHARRNERHRRRRPDLAPSGGTDRGLIQASKGNNLGRASVRAMRTRCSRSRRWDGCRARSCACRGLQSSARASDCARFRLRFRTRARARAHIHCRSLLLLLAPPASPWQNYHQPPRVTLPTPPTHLFLRPGFLRTYSYVHGRPSLEHPSHSVSALLLAPLGASLRLMHRIWMLGPVKKFPIAAQRRCHRPDPRPSTLHRSTSMSPRRAPRRRAPHRDLQCGHAPCGHARTRTRTRSPHPLFPARSRVMRGRYPAHCFRSL